eukprot:9485753-Pyramimonas_sp.AAC.1
MYKEAGGRRNRGDMQGQADTRLKNTTVGMLRGSCCCEMGWWGYAKRKELASRPHVPKSFERLCGLRARRRARMPKSLNIL